MNSAFHASPNTPSDDDTFSPTTHPLILTRLYHRWIPRLAKEPTSTLLLITPLNRFVDLRFSLTSPPLLLHGTAGTYIRTHTSGLRGYTIDSQLPSSFENQYHTLVHQRNGDVREAGELLDPADHVRKEYEAVWRPAPVFPRVCVCVLLRAKGASGVVIRVGGWCQGVMRVQREVSAERWVKGNAGRWERVVRVGTEVIPCAVACLDADESGETGGGRYCNEAKGLGFSVEKTVMERDRIVVGKWEWEVVERCQW